jgi:hypothetical protein
MPQKKVKEKAGFLEDALRILFDWFSKIVKVIWDFLKKAIKGFLKEYL